MKRFALTVTTLVLAIGLSTLAFAEAAGKVDPKGAPAAGAAAPAKPVGAEAGGHQPAPLPAEVEAAAKTMVGTWRCAGTGMGKEVKGTMTFKLDPAFGKYWIVGNWKSAKTKDTPAMLGLDYRTYDPSQKKWVSMGVDNWGGWSHSTSNGPVGTKTAWEGKMTMIGMGGKMISWRMSEEQVSPKETKLNAEMTMDGKTWAPMWESTCKK